MDENTINLRTAYLTGYVDGIAQGNTYSGGYVAGWSNFEALPKANSIHEALVRVKANESCDFWMREVRSVGGVELSKTPKEFVRDIFQYWLFDLPDQPIASQRSRETMLREIWSNLEDIAPFKKVYEVMDRKDLPKKKQEVIGSRPPEAFQMGGTFILEADDVRVIFYFNVVD